MTDILTSIHGRKLGLDKDGNLVVAGTKLIMGHDTGLDLPVTFGAAKEIAAGAAITLTTAQNGNTVALDNAAGSVATLPAATGSGARFRFYVKTLATSASHKIQVANANDFMIGIINGTRVDVGNAVLGFAAANSGVVATNSDTITLNRSTTGSVSKGEWIEVEDVLANTWAVSGVLSATGAAFASPFSAAV